MRTCSYTNSCTNIQPHTTGLVHIGYSALPHTYLSQSVVTPANNLGTQNLGLCVALQLSNAHIVNANIPLWNVHTQVTPVCAYCSGPRSAAYTCPTFSIMQQSLTQRANEHIPLKQALQRASNSPQTTSATTAISYSQALQSSSQHNNSSSILDVQALKQTNDIQQTLILQLQHQIKQLYKNLMLHSFQTSLIF